VRLAALLAEGADMSFVLPAATADNTQPVVTGGALDRRRKLAEALMAKGMDMSPVQSPWQGAARLAQAMLGAYDEYQVRGDERRASDSLKADLAGIMGGDAPAATATPSATPAANGPTPGAANDVENQFIGGIQKAGLSNPYGLAAVAATGRRESSFDPKRMHASWSDPSESGQPGTSGGIMSWRAERLANLQNFARQRGEQGYGSPETQAAFTASEDPTLIPRLNAAKSPQEATRIMADAWRFAGFNRPGGEYAAREALTEQLAGRFKGMAQPAVDRGGMAGVAPQDAMTSPMDRGLPAGVDPRSMTQPMPGVQMAQASQPGVQSDASPVGRVAQALGGQPAPQQAAPAQSSAAARVAQAMRVLDNPMATPAQRSVAQGFINRQMAQEQRDPNEARLKQLQVQQAEAAMADRPLTRRQQELAVKKAERDLQAGFRAATPQEKQALNLEPNAPVQIGPDGRAYPIVEGSGRTDASRATEDRRRAAEAVGLKPDNPAYQSFLLTGKMPREDQQPLSASDKKVIVEADEAVAAGEGAIQGLRRAMELSKDAYEGPFANTRAQAMAVVGDKRANTTLELDNVLATGALSQLKAIFGGAPTEGERKILLDIQGSSSMPRDVREKVYERAIAAAERRLGLARQQAENIRDRTYFKPGGSPQSQRQQAPGATAPPQQQQPAAGGFRIISVD
jgi:hypothetical protein